MPNLLNRPAGAGSLLPRALAVILAVTVLPAFAQQPPEPVRQAVQTFLERQADGLPGEVDVRVGELDASNRLPECAALEPFLPSGTRAWGRISVGVRCDSPVTWTIYVPAQVAVMTGYLVTAQPLRPGQVVGPADIERRFGDLASEPPNTMTEAARAIGQRARYAIAAGTTLRTEMLRLPPAVRQGQDVKVVGSGSGFKVTNEGRALNAAAEGEPVRVRLDNGQVVSGIARAAGVVEIGF